VPKFQGKLSDGKVGENCRKKNDGQNTEDGLLVQAVSTKQPERFDRRFVGYAAAQETA
jgi:hypothetical protein